MKRMISILLVFILVMSTITGVYATDEKSEVSEEDYNYRITTKDKEWKDFKTKSEMVNACSIPKEKLSKMSTKQLLNAVLDYPMLIDLLMFTSEEEGLKALADNSDAYRELLNRDDYTKVLSNKLNKKDISRENPLVKRSLEILVRDRIDKNTSSENVLLTYTRASTTTVTTPNGTPVPVTMYGEEYTDKEKDFFDDDIKETYPNATFVSSTTSNYNCHSYAWYLSSTSNKYWMNNPAAYMTDGSYVQVSSPYDASHIYYPVGGHSAKVMYVTSQYLSETVVKSKWGNGPLMIHEANYSPYSISRLSAWKRD